MIVLYQKNTDLYIALQIILLLNYFYLLIGVIRFYGNLVVILPLIEFMVN